MNSYGSTARTAAIIVAAGSGSRFGSDMPKQYLPLAGRPVLAHCHAAFKAHPRIGEIIVVIGAGQEAAAYATLGPDVHLVTGGATRRQSVLAGLEKLVLLGGADHVLIHDAARPFLPAAVIDRLIDALATAPGAIPVTPVVDTLARLDGDAMGENVDRATLGHVQTPQAFHFDRILSTHREWSAASEPTDDASMLRAKGGKVAIVEGDRRLEKITHEADLPRMERLMGATQYEPRVGTGYDVHRLEPGKPLWLCGIKVAHDHGLSGHSDADVAIHALVDAMLGALADGDIGSHFPPSDEQWRGAASSRFLAFARDRVRACGGRISHVDLTIICEAPKIGPHRDAMRASLADILEIDNRRVSVKATTTEKLGFTGRREGIAVQAVCTLLLPEL